MYSNSVARTGWLREVSAIWQEFLSMGERIFSEERMTEVALLTLNLLILGVILVSLYRALVTGPY